MVKNKILSKIVFEFNNEIHTLEGEDAIEWQKQMNDLMHQMQIKGVDIFKFNKINFNITKK